MHMHIIWVDRIEPPKSTHLLGVWVFMSDFFWKWFKGGWLICDTRKCNPSNYFYSCNLPGASFGYLPHATFGDIWKFSKTTGAVPCYVFLKK